MNNRTPSAIHLRDSLFIPVAKVYFVLTSYGIYFGLARMMKPEQFGIYGIVIGIVSILNMIFVTGTIQSVSKFVSEDAHKEPSIRKSAFAIQLFLGGGVAILYYWVAPIIARAMRDPEIIPYLRISSSILFFYALYAVFIGTLNGQKLFKTQALFDISYSSLKVVCILSLVYLTHNVKGAIAGFVFASVVITVVSLIKFGIPRRVSTFPFWPILRFALVSMGVAGIMNLIQQADLLMLKAMTGGSEGNLLTGYYTAALTIARAPYMIVVSLGLILFPLISNATHQKDRKESARLIQQGLRIGLILSAPAAILFSSLAIPTVQLLYPHSYAPAANALIILAPGYFLLTLLMIALSIISGADFPHLSLMILMLTLAVQICLGIFLIPRYSLEGAAYATAFAATVGLLVSGLWLYNHYGAFINALTVVRILAASSVIYAAARLFPVHGIILPVFDLLLSLIYIAVLWFLKEWSWEEIRPLWRGRRVNIPLEGAREPQ